MNKRLDILNISQNKKTGKWRWNLQSAYNGKIKASGQASGFSSKNHALTGFDAVARSCREGVRVKEAKT